MRPASKWDLTLAGHLQDVHQISLYTGQFDLAGIMSIRWVQAVSLLHYVVENSMVRQWVLPTPSGEIGREKKYLVSNIDDSQMSLDRFECLIQCTVYKSLTWEPAKFADGLQPVGEFHHWYPVKLEPWDDVFGGPPSCGGGYCYCLDYEYLYCTSSIVYTGRLQRG